MFHSNPYLARSPYADLSLKRKQCSALLCKYWWRKVPKICLTFKKEVTDIYPPSPCPMHSALVTFVFSSSHTSPPHYSRPIYSKSFYPVKVKVTQSCRTLCNPMDYTVHGTLQARKLEWVAFPFSRGSSQPRDRTQVSCTEGGFFTSWTTREIQESGGSSQSLLQWIFPTQESNWGLLHCRQIFLSTELSGSSQYMRSNY